jgi:hypothetical protein
MFHGQTHHFRGLGAARDAKNAQQDTVAHRLPHDAPLASAPRRFRHRLRNWISISQPFAMFLCHEVIEYYNM